MPAPITSSSSSLPLPRNNRPRCRHSTTSTSFLLLAAAAALFALAVQQASALPMMEAAAEAKPMFAEASNSAAVIRVRRSPSALMADEVFGSKRAGAKGFHEGIFDQGFGGFTTLKRKRRPEMTSKGIHGDAFTADHDALDFLLLHHPSAVHMAAKRPQTAHNSRYILHRKSVPVHKRLSNRGLDGFDGDTFSGGFGEFETARKRKRMGTNADNNGFYGDTFSDGFGDFATTKRKRLSGSTFHGDTFNDGGFGDFETT